MANLKLPVLSPCFCGAVYLETAKCSGIWASSSPIWTDKDISTAKAMLVAVELWKLKADRDWAGIAHIFRSCMTLRYMSCWIVKLLLSLLDIHCLSEPISLSFRVFEDCILVHRQKTIVRYRGSHVANYWQSSKVGWRDSFHVLY